MKEYELYVDSFYQIPGVGADTGGTPDGTVSGDVPGRAEATPADVTAKKVPLVGTTEVATPENELWWNARSGAEAQVDRDAIDGPKTVNNRD